MVLLIMIGHLDFKKILQLAQKVHIKILSTKNKSKKVIIFIWKIC